MHTHTHVFVLIYISRRPISIQNSSRRFARKRKLRISHLFLGKVRELAKNWHLLIKFSENKIMYNLLHLF